MARNLSPAKRREIKARKRLLRELHPNGESYIEQIVDFVPQPDAPDYCIASQFKRIQRLWIYRPPYLTESYQKDSLQSQSRPIFHDPIAGVTLY